MVVFLNWLSHVTNKPLSMTNDFAGRHLKAVIFLFLCSLNGLF